MNTETQNETIEVTGNELQFIMNNEPTAFARSVAEALQREGYNVDRVKVFQELRTIKKRYDSRIISKSRELLKVLSQVEFQNQ